MLGNESFRKKNPHEISSEQIFGESISNIGYASSVQNNFLSVDKRTENLNDISNLKRNTSSMFKQKEPSEYSATVDSRLQNDPRLYNYSETDNTRFLATPDESNLRRRGPRPGGEALRGLLETSGKVTPGEVLTQSMKTSLIQEAPEAKRLPRASSQKRVSRGEKLKLARRSRSKSKSKANQVNAKRVEAIPEVDQEYKERSSHWSQASLFQERKSVQEKGLGEQVLAELHNADKGGALGQSDRSTRTNKYAANRSQASTERSLRKQQGSKGSHSKQHEGATRERVSEGTISTKRVSWTKFPEEMGKAPAPAKGSKSQTDQELEKVARPHKPIKSAAYEQVYRECMQSKLRQQLHLDRELHAHKQEASGVSGDMKSLHTYKNSLASGANALVSDGVESGRQGGGTPLKGAKDRALVEIKDGGISEEDLLSAEGAGAELGKAGGLEHPGHREQGKKGPITMKMKMAQKKLYFRRNDKPKVPRQSSLDLDDFAGKYSSSGSLFFRESFAKGSAEPNANLYSSQLVGGGRAERDIKINMVYRGHDTESVRASEKAQRERFNRALSRGRFARRASLGLTPVVRRRSVSKSLLDSVKIRKANGTKERERDSEKKKRKKAKITDRLYKREDLIEAYKTEMREKELSNSQKREWKRPKAPDPPKQSRGPLQSKFHRRNTTNRGERRKSSVRERRGGSTAPGKKPKKSSSQLFERAALKRKTSPSPKIKNARPRIDTGLKRKHGAIEEEQKHERRRVRKDFALEKIILPQMELRIAANFERFTQQEGMAESLAAREPADLPRKALVQKAAADALDYVSDFDAKDHLAFHVKNALLEFEFDFGTDMFSRATNTCSEIHREPGGQPRKALGPPAFASLAENQQSLRRKKKKRNLHEKSESKVLHKRRFSKKKMDKKRSGKFSAKKPEKKIRKQARAPRDKGGSKPAGGQRSLAEADSYALEAEVALAKSLVLKQSKRSFKSPKLNKHFDEDSSARLAPEAELNLYDGFSKYSGARELKLTRSDVFERPGKKNPMTRSHNNFRELKHNRGLSSRIPAKKKRQRRRTNSKHSLARAPVFLVKETDLQREAGKGFVHTDFYANNIYNSTSQDLRPPPEQSMDLYSQPRPRKAAKKDEEIQFNVSRRDNKVRPRKKLRRVKNEVSMHLDASEEPDASISENVANFIGSLRENCAEMFDLQSEGTERSAQQPRRPGAKPNAKSFQPKMFRMAANFKKNNSHAQIKKRTNSHRLKKKGKAPGPAPQAQENPSSRKSHLRHRTMGQIKNYPFMIQKRGVPRLKTTNEENELEERPAPAKPKTARPPRKAPKKKRQKPPGGSPGLLKKAAGSRKSNSSSNNQVEKGGFLHKKSTPRNLFNSPQIHKKALPPKLQRAQRVAKVLALKQAARAPGQDNYEFEMPSKEFSQLAASNAPRSPKSPRIKRKFLPPRKMPLIGKALKKPFHSPKSKGMRRFANKKNLGTANGKRSLRVSREGLGQKHKIRYDSREDTG